MKKYSSIIVVLLILITICIFFVCNKKTKAPSKGDGSVGQQTELEESNEEETQKNPDESKENNIVESGKTESVLPENTLEENDETSADGSPGSDIDQDKNDENNSSREPIVLPGISLD